jgi:hypothetical protein
MPGFQAAIAAPSVSCFFKQRLQKINILGIKRVQSLNCRRQNEIILYFFVIFVLILLFVILLFVILLLVKLLVGEYWRLCLAAIVAIVSIANLYILFF